MIEGILNDRSFMIPIQRPMSTSWYYPSSGAYDYSRPAMHARSPFEGFEVRPTSSQCQCFDCQRRIQRQDDFHSGEQIRRRGERNNRSDGARRYREIPIHVESKGIQTRSMSDKGQNGILRKDEPKTLGDMKVDTAKRNGDVALVDADNHRVFLTQEKQNEADIKGSSGMGIETEKAEAVVDDSQLSAKSMTDPIVTEEPKEIENEEDIKQTKLGKILEISNDFEKLSERVDAFYGTEKCKEYLYLEEMLMKCLLRLDEISTEGISDVRKSRKRIANSVNEMLRRLEEKLEGDLAPRMIERQGSNEIMKDEANIEDITASIDSEANDIRESENGDKNAMNKADFQQTSDELCCTSMQNQVTGDENYDEGMLQDSRTSETDILNHENNLNENETEHLTEDLEPSGKSDFESSNSENQTACS